jgi:hypothetical protein
VANAWKSLTALGHEVAQVVVIGPYQITERFDVALASLAVRRGQDAAFASAAQTAGVPLPPQCLARFGSRPRCGLLRPILPAIRTSPRI